MKSFSSFKEQDLFEWLKEGHMPDLALSGYQFSKWDCISDKEEGLIELKCRRKHYPTMLIEKKKYDAMLTVANNLGYTPVYINSTPEGIYSWNLAAIDIDWKVETKHPATTAFGNRMRVPKEVGYLDIKDAVCLTQP